jgi:hypothetical protein
MKTKKAATKPAITAEDIAGIRDIWKVYKQDRRTYELSRLGLGRRLFTLQQERAKPKTGNFVEYICEQVEFPTSTAYQLIKYFRRVSGIVEVNERIEKAAVEADIDLTAKRTEPALKKFATELKKAESLPDTRKVLAKIAAFKPPQEAKPEPLTGTALVGIHKGKALQAVQHYLDHFSGEKRLTQWAAFAEEVALGIADVNADRPAVAADEVKADDAKPAAKKPASKKPAGKAKVSVPLMITKQMESKLRAAGHSQSAIDKMTPEQATEALNKPAVNEPAKVVA